MIGLPLVEHSDAVFDVVFSPDGKIVASGGYDGVIILWDTQTREIMGQLTHDATIYSLAFSPDGKTLAAGNYDHTILLWNLDPQYWIEQSCERIGRNLTLAEWNEYFPREEYRIICPQWPAGE
jgi:WD40 repeat protein